MNGRVPVHVCALDPISEVGIAATLRPRPEVLLVDEPDSSTVTVVVADTVGEQTQALMRRVQGKGCRRIVLAPRHSTTGHCWRESRSGCAR